MNTHVVSFHISSKQLSSFSTFHFQKSGKKGHNLDLTQNDAATMRLKEKLYFELV